MALGCFIQPFSGAQGLCTRGKPQSESPGQKCQAGSRGEVASQGPPSTQVGTSTGHDGYGLWQQESDAWGASSPSLYHPHSESAGSGEIGTGGSHKHRSGATSRRPFPARPGAGVRLERRRPQHVAGRLARACLFRSEHVVRRVGFGVARIRHVVVELRRRICTCLHLSSSSSSFVDERRKRRLRLVAQPRCPQTGNA